ncbi:hypothetical protein Ahy_B04g070934 [Arachis hypogaea]|uniref:SAC domain-containing protein n=1 Tax=Arachis hypogaea TaxID=3818 RepID=A0A444ZJJ3_ARAHY|nr:hypothetical protein Ahy_B04g070934 [Arachis hypogaea]
MENFTLASCVNVHVLHKPHLTYEDLQGKKGIWLKLPIEKRYKKLLCTVDLTKDFFFNSSYHIMCSLQRNMCDNETGHVLYETMFVWNEFLTRGIRNHLQNALWTVDSGGCRCS